MAKFIEEFREFAVKGNMIDLAVGIMIGGAFNKIVNSLVNDIIMPPIGLLLGKVNFVDLFVNLSDTEALSVVDAKAKGIPTINYGVFINESLNFFIIAVILFLIVKVMNRLRREQEAKETTKADAAKKS